MNELLYVLNKTPGVLGSVWLEGGRVAFDMGEAVGGAEAVPLAERAAEACRAWIADGRLLETATFSAERGRLLLRAVGDGMLVVFAESDAGAGLIKVRMREMAEKMRVLDAVPGAA